MLRAAAITGLVVILDAVVWRGAEILGDIGCERGLIAFEREQVVGAEGDDLLGDLG